MDASAAVWLKGTNFFCRLSSSRSVPSASAPLKKNQLTEGGSSSVLFRKFPSWACPCIARNSSGGILKISARLQRPLRQRRNTLRDKLLPSPVEQVRRVPDSLDSVTDLEPSEDGKHQAEGFCTQMDAEGKNEVSKELCFEGGSLPETKSALQDKLENWVDQYKVDSEFWGVGAGHIFTIYLDSDKKVVNVFVNEDEIIKRSRVHAWSLEEKDELEESTVTNSKIFRANLIARMIESGEYALPKNSSVVKFIPHEKKSSFSEGLRSVSLQVQPILKMFPNRAFTLLCGFCVLWATMKLFVQNEQVELSREEAEMLRRKIKLRMEREDMEKGSIKVLDDTPELPVFNRPQLDQNELMKSIIEAKTSSEKSFMINSSSDLYVQTPDFNEKVKEIREMARRIREQEQQDISEPETSKKIEVDSVSPNDYKSRLVNKKNAVLEIESNGEASNVDITYMKNPHMHQDTGFEFHVDRKTKGLSGNNSPERLSSTSYQESSSSLQDNDNRINNDDDRQKEAIRYSSGARSNNVDTKNIENALHSSAAEERINSSNSTEVCTRSGSENKPRIITSVKEAREFLAKRDVVLYDMLQSDKEVQDGGQSAGVSSLNHLYKDKGMNNESPGTIEDLNLVETSENFHVDSCKDLYDDGSIAAPILKRPTVDNFSINKGNVNDAMKSKVTMDMENYKMRGGIFDGLSDDTDQLFVTDSSVSGSFEPFDSKTGVKLNSREMFIEAVNSVDLQTDSSTPEIRDLSEEQKVVEDQRDGCTLNDKLKLEYPATSTYEVKTLSTNPLKDDKLGQPQELVGLKDMNKFTKETQRLQFEFNESEIPVDKSALVTESKVVGTSKLDQDESSTLSGFDPSLQSITETLDTNLKFGDMLGELEPPQSATNAFDVSNKGQNTSSPRNSSTNSGEIGFADEGKQLNAGRSWIEENFQELEPVIAKIRTGFKENYMVAKENMQQQPNLSAQMSELRLTDIDNELEWMNDERLQRIVFQVRDNELAGKDPFDSMDAEDKILFFKGLESKVEKVNGELLRAHEWVHSRIENLDYGADGISLHDPLEKIIPRWKAPPVDRNPEFLRYQKPIFTKEDAAEIKLQKTENLPNSEGVSSSSVDGIRRLSLDASSMKSKSVIESSDGNIRPGKKNGKEHWQHTKKWSQGFLEVYNAEKDPEIKAIMREMGKDLDRWITEKDTQDMADLMKKMPTRRRRYIEKKLEKVKREVEMFGVPAVVSKYREYAEEKEEDYLWWLDLPCVLCLELYTIEEGVPKVGFYSLEMAEDLELNPKQYHVIAFEDAGDSKNFCYILQAHMDMLGSGKAFVVARPPKDAFREAKANGFSVTVIRNGQIKLNVDQTLEEVEEEITEIGSKFYHDKIMHERSVDVNTLMKGVAAAEKSTKKGSINTLTKGIAAAEKSTKRRSTKTRKKTRKHANPAESS
ncbi:uncharacterized protein LOC122022437 isoform X2 [Zingiber officinale]|uniref:Uncharacterized protein n=1 Tax=Zingiber officinale TaxID=94328 RepID=A0A8J5EYI7_ZINOF|nr:uncharacterized protein LOC122022437 isoform X2 [Zingiber officinale]KAG6477100.1 hypothetical protein ZIOFF_066352 [Zingiber officinale]